MLFRVTVKKTLWLETEIEAESVEDAREEAQSGGHDWRDTTGGRGLGDDDVEVLDVEQIDESEDESENEDESDDDYFRR